MMPLGIPLGELLLLLDCIVCYCFFLNMVGNSAAVRNCTSVKGEGGRRPQLVLFVL
jgi:hypothetical protein